MNLDKNFSLNNTRTEKIKWIDPLNSNELTIYGFAYIESDKVYNRLPLDSLDLIRGVAPNLVSLATNTSGGQIHFKTKSKKIILDVELSVNVNLSGMTASAQGGFDFYVGKSYDDLKFYDATRFPLSEKKYTFTFDTRYMGDEQLIVINFPLYNGVKSLNLGFDEDSYIVPSRFKENSRIAIYGTSITQGGCASRPGLSFTNILSRRLQKEIINFGFSGNAFGEKEIREIFSGLLDIDIFILDYEANAGTNGLLEKTLEDFIKIIREKNKNSKIIVLSRIKYLFDDLYPALGKRREEIRVFQENTVNKFKELGDENIYYIDGSKILGSDYHEYTVDSIHPNDLGFMKIADALEEYLKKSF